MFYEHGARPSEGWKNLAAPAFAQTEAALRCPHGDENTKVIAPHRPPPQTRPRPAGAGVCGCSHTYGWEVKFQEPIALTSTMHGVESITVPV